jgi:hypothetical protein
MAGESVQILDDITAWTNRRRSELGLLACKLARAACAPTASPLSPGAERRARMVHAYTVQLTLKDRRRRCTCSADGGVDGAVCLTLHSSATLAKPALVVPLSAVWEVRPWTAYSLAPLRIWLHSEAAIDPPL